MGDVRAQLKSLMAQPIAHRGLHACGGAGPVENSLSAARAAIAAGYAIECDVRLSRDDEVMVFHDRTLDRLTAAAGEIGACEARDLRSLQLRGGPDRIPSLREFLATIGGRVPLVIEFKSDGVAEGMLVARTLALLKYYSGTVALESFDPQIVRLCRAKNTHRPVGLVGPPEQDGALDQDELAACDFVSWSIERLAEIVEIAPALPRSTWTVRSPTQAATAARLGAQIVFEGFSPSSSVNRVAAH